MFNDRGTGKDGYTSGAERSFSLRLDVVPSSVTVLLYGNTEGRRTGRRKKGSVVRREGKGVRRRKGRILFLYYNLADTQFVDSKIGIEVMMVRHTEPLTTNGRNSGSKK